MTSTVSDIYDALAPYYREYSEKKTAYISAVDAFVLENIPSGAASLLDVGAGDGVRGMAIAKQKAIKTVILSDSSAEMVAKCRILNPTDVWHVPAEDLPDTTERFDVILCLWNVLGHLRDSASRVRALSKMRTLLSERGRIYLDINNRHNAPAYGWLRVLVRICIDSLAPDERRGDASYDWVIAGKVFPGMGHLFTSREIERAIHDSGLFSLSRVAVNYQTGKVSKQCLKGQLAYELTARLASPQ